MAAVAIVVGSGRGVYQDVSALGDLARGAFVFGVNNMIELYSHPVDHGVSHHPEKLLRWHANRIDPRRPGDPGKIVLHTSESQIDGVRCWPQFRGPGSSSLLAVRVAVELGFRPVIVAGVPLDASGYLWGDPDLADNFDFAHNRTAWIDALGALSGRVFAVSGYLRGLLGVPQQLEAVA